MRHSKRMLTITAAVSGAAMPAAMTWAAQTERPAPAEATTPGARTSQPVAMLDAIPPDILREMLDPDARFVESPALVWRTRVVTVAFEDASTAVYELIEATANEWIQGPSRIRLSFRDERGAWRQWSRADSQSSAAIRISFAGGSYWSAVGVTAEGVRPSKQTMNLGGFANDLTPFLGGRDPQGWRRSYYRTVILHEFGHALGLSHEHFHPDCQGSLNLPRVVDYLRRRNGWSEEQARFNADAAYYQAQVEAADVRFKLSFSQRIDRSSVMLYNLPADVTGPNSRCTVQDPVGYPTSLSSGDRQTFRRNYAPT